MDNYQQKVEIITKLLYERAAVFPVRDSSYEQLSAELKSFAAELLSEIDFENYKYDMDLIERSMAFSESPVFICGPMKSGTTLLVHLLDSHPDLQVMPGDSHFVNQLAYWKRSQFDDIASYWIHRIINPTGQEPFWFFGKDVEPFKVFLAYLNYFLNNTNKEIFVCVVMSFYVVRALFNNESSKMYWVEKTPHNELHAMSLSRMFPNAKFIHILRDPLNNIVSLKKLDAFLGDPVSAYDYARVLRKLFKVTRTNVKELGEARYMVVRYEDLTKEPVKVMKQIADFLCIPYIEMLVTPTENGNLAVSNSMFQADRVKGKILNREQNNLHIEEYTSEELQDVVTTLYSEALAAGYPWDKKEILQHKKRGFSYLLHIGKSFFKNISAKFSGI